MDVFQTTAIVLELLHEVVKYINDFRHANKDRTRLLTFLQAVDASLQTLYASQDLLPNKIWESDEKLKASKDSLAELKTFLGDLKKKLDPKSQEERRMPSRLGEFSRNLRWPFEKSSVDKMVANLLRLHQVLLGIQSQLLHHMTNTKIEELGDRVQAEYERAELENQMKWLSDIKLSDVVPDDKNSSLEVRPKWFWDNREFCSWESMDVRTDRGSLLWCPGQLGVGKTVFAKCLWEALLEKHRRNDVVALVFYFHYKQHDIHTTDALFGYLCRQTLELRQGLLSIVQAHRQGKDQSEPKDLYELVKRLLYELKGSFIILDGFDECDNNNAGQILSKFRKLLLEITTLRVLITGRDSCRLQFVNDPSMEIVALDTDIESYVCNRFPEISNNKLLLKDEWSEDEQARLVNRIVAQSGSRFLLARSHMNALQGSLSLYSLESNLEKLGSDINQVYDACLDRISTQTGSLGSLGAKAILWVVHAKRLLRVNEVLQAYVASLSSDDFNDQEFEPLTQDHLIASTAGLIQVHQETSDVSIHKSLQDYFEQGGNKMRHFPDAEYEIARICLKYLCFKRFASGHCASEPEWNARISENAFFEYAALNWGHHVFDLKENRILNDVLDLLLDNRSISSAAEAIARFPASLGPQRWLLPRGNPKYFPRKEDEALMKPLHLAAYFDLRQTIEQLILQNQFVDERATCGRTPLNIACMLGYADIVQVLLSHQADLNITDLEQTTCLHAAATAGHQHIVKILLKHDKSLVNKQGLHNQTALHEAAARGLVDTVITLLAEGSAPGARLKDGRNVIHLAANWGHPSVIKLIFDKDGALAQELLKQPSGDWDDMPIHSAAFGGHPDVIDVLWRLGADLEARQKTSGTALHIACQHGRPNAALKLLELGARPDALEEANMTPLHLAAHSGHALIIRLLMHFCREISGYLELRCKPKGNTALHLAATCAFGYKPNYSPYIPIPGSLHNQLHLECFKILHEAGAAICAANDLGETSLHLAATAGNLDIINFILGHLSETEESKALRQLTLDHKHTPLHKAVNEGHLDVVRRLLEAGSDPNQRTGDGKSALQLAERKDDILKLLSSSSLG
jgi:ankyrin repeat protein